VVAEVSVKRCLRLQRDCGYFLFESLRALDGRFDPARVA
jgi:hypothetical protein